jgi:hypothetical protein
MNSKKSNIKQKAKKEKNIKPKSENKKSKKKEIIIKKTFPLPPQPENYKQINELYDIGKLELVDYKGNITECDIYGSPKKKFLKDITGITSFKERLDKKLIKEFQFNNKSLYIPKVINFEGSSMFPRPLSLPFVSQAENPNKLINEIKKEGRAITKKNKTIFSLKKPLKDKNTIPSFICQKIGKNFPNERNYLIQLIDNFISEKKKEHKFEADYEEKSSNIKALKNYKKKLNENMTNELYNGKIISPSNQKDIILKYNSIRKAIYNSGLKARSSKNSDVNKIINFDAYKKLYKIKGVGNENNIFKNPNMINTFTLQNKNSSISNNIEDKNLSYSIENIKYKTLFPNKNEINPMMMKTYSLFNKGNKFKLFKNIKEEKIKNNNEYIFNDDKFKKTITTEFDKNNEESLTNTFYFNDKINDNYKNKLHLYTPKNFFNMNKKLNDNILNNNIEKYNKTANTFYKNIKNNTSRFQENNNNTYNLEKDNFSYISEEKKDDNNFKTGYNFKSIKDLKNRTAKENDLLKGFISPELKNELKHFKIYKNKKKDTTLKHYINELELIKKVNKIAVEKEKRINLFRDNLLKKKIEGKKIFEHNYKK